MKRKLSFGLAAVLLIVLMPLLAQAVQLKYEITFEYNNYTNSSGVGSFFWDDDTQLINNFTWDFGNGRTGGIDDTLAGWSDPVSAGTKAQFVFEILTLEDVHPSACSDPSYPCGIGIGPGNGLYGFPASSMAFYSRQTYQVWDGVPNPFSKEAGFSTQAAVPEPASMSLFCMGLAGLIGSRITRKKK